MANIIINNKHVVNGQASFSRGLDNEGTNFIISGVLSTHLYFDEISKIETPRYLLTGVEVLREDFGSDDYNIVYSFTAKRLEVLGSTSEGVTRILLSNEVKMIEDEMYKNDHPILGDIGEEHKDKYIPSAPKEEEE